MMIFSMDAKSIIIGNVKNYRYIILLNYKYNIEFNKVFILEDHCHREKVISFQDKSFILNKHPECENLYQIGIETTSDVHYEEAYSNNKITIFGDDANIIKLRLIL